MSKKKIFGITLAGIIVFLLIPIPINETYEASETYNRRVKFKVISKKADDEIYGFPELKCKYVSEVILKNIDEYGGMFTVTHYYVTHYENVVKSQSQYLEPGQNGTFRISFTHSWMQIVQGYIKSIRSDTWVQDSRLVTKHRTHLKPIIVILLECM